MVFRINEKYRIEKLRFFVLLFVFIIVFLFFFINNKFYVPSKAIINTECMQDTQAKFYWDTGMGFNERECIEFKPNLVKPLENKIHTVIIKRLDDKNQNSKGTEVWIEKIIFSKDKNFDINKLVNGCTFINDNQMLSIKSINDSIEFNEKFDTMDIYFYSHQWSGKVELIIDGHKQIIDLYSVDAKENKISLNGGFTKGVVKNEFDLPQIKLKAFKVKFTNTTSKVTNASIVSENGTVSLNSLTKENLNEIDFNGFNPLNNSNNIMLIIIQVLLSLIIIYIIHEVWDYVEKLEVIGFGEKLKYIFWGNTHYVFWIMLFVSISIFSIWLIGQWPGIMTVDSYYFTWKEIKTFDFKNVTPWVYNLYVLALTQIYDSPAVVPIFQIISTSLVATIIFYYSYKNGAKKWLVFSSYLLFVFSIPVGMYNITLWKDIPFNTIMLLFGFLAYYLYFNKKYNNRNIEFTIGRMFIISLLFILLLTLRHNGIIFMILVPIIFYKLLNRKNFMQFMAISCGIFSIYTLITPKIVTSDLSETNNFFSITYKVNPLAAIYSSNYYYSPNREKDLQLINKWVKIEELKKIYNPVSQADNILVAKWSALSKDDQSQLKHLYLIRSFQNLNIFLADRTSMFFGTMGFSGNNFISTNELKNTSDKSFWRPIEMYRYVPSTKTKSLTRIQDLIISTSKSFKCNIPIGMIIFNSFPSFITLLIVLFLYKWYPASALYSLIFLYNIPFLYIALSTCEWRYLYFLYLSTFFIFTLVSMEKFKQHKIKFHG